MPEHQIFKPQRTRILEREVQKGEHEKVQGGYGKYQGTWIPIERGLDLAKTYNCEHNIRPIVEFQPEAKSPPLAPKHLPNSRRGDAGGSTISTRSSRRREQGVEGSELETLSVRASEDGTMTPSPSRSSTSRTPSPLGSPGPSALHSNGGADDEFQSPRPDNPRKRKHRAQNDDFDEEMQENGEHDPSVYGDQILEYFISDTNQIPEILVSPPEDFDPDMAIDDDGHTALHWAAAMGRIRIVKLLISERSWSTALMRSVMFANNYDVRKFPELYELLHRSTLNIDNSNRTIFHHIVDLAMTKGKAHAARYYMEAVLSRLSGYPKELTDIINFQDEEGETALTMAARCRSKRLVKTLIDHHADPKVANRDGKNAEDYILRTRTSFSQAAAAILLLGLGHHDRAPLHHSTTGQKAATRCVNDVAMMLESLAAAFDTELREKERGDPREPTRREPLESAIASAPQAKQQLTALEEELHNKMGKRYRLGRGGARDGIRGVHGGGLPADEDVADLLALHAGVPTDPEVVRAECERLRGELAIHKRRRKDKFEELVKFQAEAGTSGHMRTGCGGVPPAEVDNVLGMLLETLEAEEPSSSSAAWSGSGRPPAPS
ncbi:uncharacterized protein B0H18DRAFT_1081238 [Fomitopsis serialis]|uniref:uncharacterized protein n=1 Tax=Fomitopsis serialis TaxID=139415 RepID=UPI0020083EAC|nr:uncharacterized protein B0H18DRAFT_1081238 [Neoantrodia serialis]KAH9938663.1 hypothetical protein B0H18DRAFT_1081238 [Neoantrodia serialis]